MLLQTLTHVIVICMLSMREQIYCIYSIPFNGVEKSKSAFKFSLKNLLFLLSSSSLECLNNAAIVNLITTGD